MTLDEEGFLYPCIDEDRCVNCGLCQKICPQVNNILNAEGPSYFGGIVNANELLMKSSSGGAFSRYVIYLGRIQLFAAAHTVTI